MESKEYFERAGKLGFSCQVLKHTKKLCSLKQCGNGKGQDSRPREQMRLLGASLGTCYLIETASHVSGRITDYLVKASLSTKLKLLPHTK
jgi:hypothetical protein